MKRRYYRSLISGALATGSAVFFSGITGMGCLDRPIGLNEPRLSSRIVEIVPNSSITKIDLLLGIDNSASMADKQQILAQAVPDLVERLVNPRCVDEAGVAIAQDSQPARPEMDCPVGSRREFAPVMDIHIGLVSSSLGGHGGQICPDKLPDAACGSVSQNDHGEFVARKSACSSTNDLPTYENKGFLVWDPQQTQKPPGEKDLGDIDGSKPGLIPTLADMVRGAGQRGCGYESQLESIYRFLVEPDPYKSISVVNGKAEMSGTDTDLLAQRAAFLRPDSLVAVLMLSDENDCSLKEGDDHFWPAMAGHMPRPRAVCQENPQDPCCSSCGLAVPAGCPADPTCFDEHGEVRRLSAAEDPINLRCFDQKRRFGKDFLYPTERYVKGFTETTIADRAGNVVDNPLFPKVDREAGLVAPRVPSMFFLAGIVGVPWQDIARDPQDLSRGYKTWSEMAGDETWKWLLGDPESGIEPVDPLMRESVDARIGIHPVTGEPTDLTPGSPLGNSINGHERVTNGEDLQYACIFDLPTPSSCAGDATCECAESNASSPLCDPNAPKSFVRAKAYPSPRQLGVLRDLKGQGIVASVCPQQVVDRAMENYGYRAAIGALVDQLKNRINGPCLPRTLAADKAGQVQCVALEARNSGGTCSCDKDKARVEIDASHQGLIEEAKNRSPGNDWDCFCEIPQLEGEDLKQCQNEVSDAPVRSDGQSIDGYCYVDATTEPTIGNPIHVATCPDNDRRRIRLVGKGEPAKDATLILSCYAEP